MILLIIFRTVVKGRLHTSTRRRWHRKRGISPPARIMSIYIFSSVNKILSIPCRYNARVVQQFFEKESVVSFVTSCKETGAGTIMYDRAPLERFARRFDATSVALAERGR